MAPNWQHSAIAVTGSIGSGKSTFCDFLEQRGAFCVDADQLARDAVVPGSTGLTKLVEEFGEEILADDQTLDRKKLGMQVFNDPAKLRALEAITHPIIRELAATRFAEAAQQGYPLYVYQVPLLFETGLDKAGFKKIVLVATDDQTALERVATRDDISQDEAKDRLAAQIPTEEKRQRADIVIENNGSLEALKQKADELFALLSGK